MYEGSGKSRSSLVSLFHASLFTVKSKSVECVSPPEVLGLSCDVDLSSWANENCRIVARSRGLPCGVCAVSDAFVGTSGKSVFRPLTRIPAYWSTASDMTGDVLHLCTSAGMCSGDVSIWWRSCGCCWQFVKDRECNAEICTKEWTGIKWNPKLQSNDGKGVTRML